TGSLRAGGPDHGVITLEVPADRRPESASLSVRLSPSLALAMLDTLPYLIEYPYGCTEQTTSRFLPAVLTMKTLERLGVKPDQLGDPHTNLNPQQVGGPRSGRTGRTPVYSQRELERVVRAGLKRLADFQRGDGGWGWWADDQPSTYLTA